MRPLLAALLAALALSCAGHVCPISGKAHAECEYHDCWE
jgi:hypothetical protein